MDLNSITLNIPGEIKKLKIHSRKMYKIVHTRKSPNLLDLFFRTREINWKPLTLLTLGGKGYIAFKSWAFL